MKKTAAAGTAGPAPAAGPGLSPGPDTVTHRLLAAGDLLRRGPGRARGKPPPRHIERATARLGPDTCPAPYTLQARAAILDGPGRAQRG
ncbi:hypothetical protein [Streptomyces sp. NPDC059092]|uniref:hypothetical protein n=1 Tax=Streptomyces sp. NPDC059092 TaxID=3346725 RepID=UPI00368900B7